MDLHKHRGMVTSCMRINAAAYTTLKAKWSALIFVVLDKFLILIAQCRQGQ